MKPQEKREVYREALESANAELAEISSQIEDIRIRKAHIEGVIAALKPLISEVDGKSLSETSASPAVLSDAQPTEATDHPVAVSVEEMPVPRPLIADPFQRRIAQELRSTGTGDLRKYSRQF